VKKSYLIILAFAIALVWLFMYRLDQYEQKECREWQTVKAPYTWANWQIEQCTHWSLPLPE